MVDFLEELNDYYVRNRGKRIKQEFREVLAKEPDELTGTQRHIYEIYIEPNLNQLQNTLYEAFKEANSPRGLGAGQYWRIRPAFINHAKTRCHPRHPGHGHRLVLTHTLPWPYPRVRAPNTIPLRFKPSAPPSIPNLVTAKTRSTANTG